MVRTRNRQTPRTRTRLLSPLFSKFTKTTRLRQLQSVSHLYAYCSSSEKMQVQRIVQQIAPKMRVFARSYANHGHASRVTMDDLPVPKGSWKANYDQNQTKYNRHLAIGVVVMGLTLAFGQANGLLRMYDDIPDQPAVVESYAE